MSDLDRIYCEENIGLPIKARMGRDEHNKISYIYGRYCGRGSDGQSDLQDSDYHLITLATADGNLVSGGIFNYEVIKDNKEELEKLKYFEELEEKPYSPHLSVVNGKFCKCHEQKKNYKHYPLEWLEENGYFEIDVNLFGNALGMLFTAYLGKKYFYNAVHIQYEGKSECKLDYYDKIESRTLFLLSTEEHKGYNTIYFDAEEIPNTRGKRVDSMFKEKPISLKDNNYLIDFGGYTFNDCKKIKLGTVEDDKFIPNTSPFADSTYESEVNYNNQNTDLVEDFICEIIDYKLSSKKATLDQEDMNKILKKYGISYNNEINKLITVLKNAREKAINEMSKTNQVGKVLCLHK